MIKIICDGDKTLADSGGTKVVGYHGLIKLEGDKETIEAQLTNVFFELMKASPDLFDVAMKNAIEELSNVKSN